MKFSQRLAKLPPYLFSEIDRRKKEALAHGVDIISLGVGDPDRPTPAHIVKAGRQALEKPANHQYPFGAGMPLFRRTVADWMRRRFDVDLNADTEILPLIGSKEGLGHLPLAILDAGQTVLIPEPAYPVYRNATLFAGGEAYEMPLLEARGYLPDLGKIPPSVLQRSQLLFLNYPNNPTAATAPRAFLEDVVRFARQHEMIVAYDNAYSEIYFEQPPLSLLQIPGGRDVSVEFHSLSKTYNMTGWRVGWVCGHAEVIRALAQIKDSYDSGVFQAVQEAAAAALSGPSSCTAEMRALYRKRRDLFVDWMKKAGWDLPVPPATFYVWARAPKGFDSAATAAKLLEEAGIVCTPGAGFGAVGEGYVRFALTVEEARLREAAERIGKVKWKR